MEFIRVNTSLLHWNWSKNERLLHLQVLQEYDHGVLSIFRYRPIPILVIYFITFGFNVFFFSSRQTRKYTPDKMCRITEKIYSTDVRGNLFHLLPSVSICFIQNKWPGLYNNHGKFKA